MKKLIKTLFFVFILVSAGFSYYIYTQLNYSNKTVQYPISFQIKPGMNLNQILNILKSKKLIQSNFPFKIYNKIFPYSKKLKTGKYSIKTPVSGLNIIRKIIKGEIELVKITIIEGLTVSEIFRIINQTFHIPITELLAISQEPDFIKKNIRTDANSLEGFLFPETYLFSENPDPKNILSKMIQLFYSTIEPIWDSRPSDFQLSFYETMVLASIIECEVFKKDEHKKVSSVYHNRLRKRMKLQADPTVQYALPQKKERLLYKDLEVESPYNTYQHRGLPPGPISNFGVKSFQAAIYPDTTDFLYFVADIDGQHIFSRTVEEHNQNKQIIKRKRRRLKWKEKQSNNK